MSSGKIEHVVVLMLENHSFDSLLGWLYESDAPLVNIPPAAEKDRFRGLAGVDLAAFVNTAENGAMSSPPVRGAEGFTVPTPDPGEEFEHVTTQFYGTSTPAPGAVPTMTGVLTDFVDVMQSFKYSGPDIARRAPSIMQSYTPTQLPVLSQLARHYGVSDAWFASVPSQTNPNRAFSLCGTSDGLVNNGELETDPRAIELEKILGMRIGDDRFPGRTIVNAVQDAGLDWMVFWQTSYLPQKISELMGVVDVLAALGADFGPLVDLLKLIQPYSSYLAELSSGTLTSCYTWRLFPQIQQIAGAAAKFAQLEEFHSLARAGNLPAFSCIEPYWTISQSGTDDTTHRALTALGNDYHPPSNLLVGEDFVKSVYESLIADADAWSKTALLITFDEFVGSFDHVVPPAVVPPWGEDGHPPYASPTGFDFKRLGARVPTILVSPYVPKGSVFRSTTDVAYDHTSIIATTLKLLGIAEEASDFGQRTANAPTFDTALELNEPRTDSGELAFLNVARSVGDPLAYGDQFVLQNANGTYLSSFDQALKRSDLPNLLGDLAVDLNLAALFPTLGAEAGKVPLIVQNADPDAGPVGDGDDVWLVSKEPGLVSADVLGAWSDSADCYWYGLYLDGAYADNERWRIQKVQDKGAPVRFGDHIRLVNRSNGHGLAHDGRPFQSRWISTSGAGDVWTIQPFVAS